MASRKSSLNLDGLYALMRPMAESPFEKLARNLQKTSIASVSRLVAESPIMRTAQHFEQLMPKPFFEPGLVSAVAQFNENLAQVTKAIQPTVRMVEEQSRFARQVADSITSAVVLPKISLATGFMGNLNSLTRLCEPPGFLRLSQIVTEAAAAAARLSLNIRLVLPNEGWRESIRRARANAPKRWREVYAAEDGLAVGDARKLEDLTTGPLGLTRDDISYVYEALLGDPWENAHDPIAYLKVAARRRRVRDEAKGGASDFRKEAERQWMDAQLASDGYVLASSSLLHDPGTLLDILRASEQLDLKPDGEKYARAWLTGITEGELLAQGWSRQRIERAKKQLQRSFVRLRGQYLQ